MKATYTTKHLQAVVDRINRLLETPATPYAIGEDGKMHPQANCYHLSHAYGGVALHKMSSDPECTGVHDIFSGHWPKRDLYNRMQSFIVGIEKGIERGAK